MLQGEGANYESSTANYEMKGLYIQYIDVYEAVIIVSCYSLNEMYVRDCIALTFLVVDTSS